MNNCPYGRPGSKLWVRETLKCHDDGVWHYAADNAPILLRQSDPRFSQMLAWAHHKDGDTCVSIHMPRFASRITLEVSGVRVERLQEISEKDAKAEGVLFDGTYWREGKHPSDGRPQHWPTARRGYQALWDVINAARAPWASNPYVWVLDFRRCS